MGIKELGTHIDEIIAMIENGKTYSNICKKHKCCRSTLNSLLSKPEHFARASQAYTMAADADADRAIEVLEDPNIDIQRAREIAHHLRWSAKMKNRNKFGDKIVTQGDPNNPIHTDNTLTVIFKDHDTPKNGDRI
jgi:hypothetical protein